jgi:hypothetical protein
MQISWEWLVKVLRIMVSVLNIKIFNWWVYWQNKDNEKRCSCQQYSHGTHPHIQWISESFLQGVKLPGDKLYTQFYLAPIVSVHGVIHHFTYVWIAKCIMRNKKNFTGFFYAHLSVWKHVFQHGKQWEKQLFRCHLSEARYVVSAIVTANMKHQLWYSRIRAS